MPNRVFPASLLLAILWTSPALADPAGFLSQPLSFCGEPVALNREEVYQAVDQNLLLLAEAKSRIWLTLRRASRYRAVIEKELNRAGAPLDLIYLPLAITGLSPDYQSGGRGIWRLREAEARAQGLRVDANIDERLDPVAATAAAARIMLALKETYGSWTTAMAAYLLGEKVISQLVAEAGGEKYYYQLYLPDDLDQLPATVLAGKIIFQNPEAFGYRQAPDRAWAPFPTRRVPVTQAQGTTARLLAAQLGQDYKTFREMNPHLLTGVIPAGVTVNAP
ncbi:MAG: transglycosylase SLT domain-containing protein [Candidatus Adiutrix sp.]|jgi:hypothetical protein|nr:transglycosylase SLT domain-containing protein [Candidatus Adiutrix sp.]